MKTLLPIPDWWYFHVEGQRVPWDTTAVYSDVFIFSLALQCYLSRGAAHKPTADQVVEIIDTRLPTEEDVFEKESLATIILLKWAELTEYVSQFGDDLNETNTKVDSVQPFTDVILVDVPNQCVNPETICRFINLRRPPIDMQ